MTAAAAFTAATTNALQLGTGKAIHAPYVESGNCRSVLCSATHSEVKQVSPGIVVEVTCKRCLSALKYREEATAAAVAQAGREALMAAEEAAETEVVRYEDQAGLAAVLRVPVEAPAAPIEFTEEMVAEAGADIDRHNAEVACMGGFRKGDQVTTKDGRVWTVEGPAQNNTTIKLVNAEGKSTFRFARNISAA